MTQLYAANPQQDAAIYDEILDEVLACKVDIVQNWLHEDQPLSGGAGKKIVKLRAHDFPNRQALISETASRISIRSTGHAWCLAQDEGCGGAGLYERTRCADCSNGVTFKPVWQELYFHQRELLDDARELGSGAIQRVTRDLRKARAVLEDLGITIESGDTDATRPKAST